ncbi:Intracellular chorismate mutase [Streptomyces sp. MBT84]|uniref:chorismate mutase n=1 Tax=unclassified Streptomyces TaxID=2593676 RepID=UPI0007410C8A|nr:MULTISPECIES: chorismate mutase [unclassified Streptomyces]KUJ51361.1 chorismate mutase [Streptomyces sp. NRRL F-5122]MBW8701431.1 Intracellular chorismate mutase [Streptomyces sp. MBT84]MDX3261546.1 chorismate mutase [Streptomyces sp. MI02-2A]REE62831.1 chorismate mutase [Streptomyces sp. 3212.3]
MTATASEQTTAEKTGAHTPEAADVINGARERIDTLDDRIIGLIQERVAVSAVVQEARISSGGRRVNLSREMEILGRYREALGKPGTSLAMTLLELCRGRI